MAGVEDADSQAPESSGASFWRAGVRAGKVFLVLTAGAGSRALRHIAPSTPTPHPPLHLHRLRHMRHGHVLGAGQVGHGACHLQRAVQPPA